MEEGKTPRTEKRGDRKERSILERGRYELRLMETMPAGFCIVLLLALLLSLVFQP